jgi:hypothetical protein
VKKALGIFGLLLFVVGVLVVPTVHDMYSAADHIGGSSTSHDPARCAICLVTALAVIAACIHVALALTPKTVRTACVAEFCVIPSLVPQARHARAPPAST